jgi:hypothetical protein
VNDAGNTEALRGGDVIIRVEPGHLPAWDYVDEFEGD